MQETGPLRLISPRSRASIPCNPSGFSDPGMVRLRRTGWKENHRGLCYPVILTYQITAQDLCRTAPCWLAANQQHHAFDAWMRVEVAWKLAAVCLRQFCRWHQCRQAVTRGPALVNAASIGRRQTFIQTGVAESRLALGVTRRRHRTEGGNNCTQRCS